MLFKGTNIYIYAFGRHFYLKRLALHSKYTFTFHQLWLFLRTEAMNLKLYDRYNIHLLGVNKAQICPLNSSVPVTRCCIVKGMILHIISDSVGTVLLYVIILKHLTWLIALRQCFYKTKLSKQVIHNSYNVQTSR